MYNVRVNAEFSSTNIHDPLHTSGTTRREGDLSEIHVADIYRRKKKKNESFLILRDRKFSSCHSCPFSQLIRVKE
jgi:hypothetical protein